MPHCLTSTGASLCLPLSLYLLISHAYAALATSSLDVSFLGGGRRVIYVNRAAFVRQVQSDHATRNDPAQSIYL
jgi:hypothetical protein